MPSLSDVLKVNGQLIKSNEEGARTLKQAANPTVTESPLAAAVGGASKDAAKMAGTQKVSGLVTTADSERKRQDVAPTVAPSKQKLLQTLNPLSNLPPQIQASVASVLAGNSAKANPTLPSVDDSLLQSALTNGADATTAKSLTSKALSGQATPSELAELAPMIGLRPTASPEEIATKVKSLSKGDLGLGDSIAKQIPDTVNLSTLTPQQLTEAGISLSETAQALGVSETELRGLSMADLREKVSALGRADFGEVTRLQQIASDPNRNASERSEAISRLRQLGASGVRSTEEAFQRLEDSVAKETTVALGGQQIPVSEILDDEFLSSQVNAYLQDGAYADKLKQDQPQFADFIEANRSALEQASKALDSSAKQLSETQVSNQKMANPGGVQLNESLLKLIYPKWGEFSATPLPPTKAHDILTKYKDTDFAQTYGDLLNDLGTNDPVMAQSMLSLSEDDLKSAGLLSKAAMQDYATYLQSARTIDRIPTDMTAIAELFGSDADEFEDLVAEAQLLERSGFLDGNIDSQLLEILDPDNDGKLASPEEVKAQLKALYGSKLPRDFASGQEPPSLSSQIKDLRAAMEVGKQGLLGQIRPYLEDGFVDEKEANEMARTLTLPELMQAKAALKGKGKGSITGTAAATLSNAIQKIQEEEWGGKLLNMSYRSDRTTAAPSSQEYAQQRNILDRAIQGADTVEEQKHYRKLRDQLDARNTPTWGTYLTTGLAAPSVAKATLIPKPKSKPSSVKKPSAPSVKRSLKDLR